MIKKKGFTLVELLAVIVILAIILVIAVPQIMDTIDSARKASIESSAKMVAAQVENQHTVSQTLGTNFPSSGDCTTAKWAGLNDKDYESCTYSIDSNGKASVTLVGKGKFEGKSVCDGTRTVASVTEDGCGLITCGPDEVMVDNFQAVKPYEVENYESCVSYQVYKGFFNSETDIPDLVKVLCSGGEFDGRTFAYVAKDVIDNGLYTEKELIENNVIKGSVTKVCVPVTSCFAFDSSTGTITGYDETCGVDVVIPSKIDGVNVTVIGDFAFTSEGEEVAVKENYSNIEYMGNNFSYSYQVVPIAQLAPEGKGIKSVVIPEGVTTIGEFAFYGNLIEELDLPSTITTIGRNAFKNNPLKSVNLRNQSASIDYTAFGCEDDIEEHNLPSTYNGCK